MKKLLKTVWSFIRHPRTSIKRGVEVRKATQVVLSSGKVGRNEACPCGSGIKYKKCCLARANV